MAARRALLPGALTDDSLCTSAGCLERSNPYYVHPAALACLVHRYRSKNGPFSKTRTYHSWASWGCLGVLSVASSQTPSQSHSPRTGCPQPPPGHASHCACSCSPQLQTYVPHHPLQRQPSTVAPPCPKKPPRVSSPACPASFCVCSRSVGAFLAIYPVHHLHN